MNTIEAKTIMDITNPQKKYKKPFLNLWQFLMLVVIIIFSVLYCRQAGRIAEQWDEIDFLNAAVTDLNIRLRQVEAGGTVGIFNEGRP